MGLDGIQGRNFNTFVRLNAQNTENLKKTEPINFNNVSKRNDAQNVTTRENLDNLPQVSDVVISEALKVASEVNGILNKFGYYNYKVTPAQVASVEYFLKTVVPKLDQACYVATEARISSPDGPFAELFAENKNI